ncbi:MAG: hypothetical protein Rubg2KO_38460 [Rubricoccaceae bacterium]
MTRLVLLTLALAIPVVAQQAPSSSPDAYDRAAGLFIDGDSENAEAAAVEGLRASPNDAKLQALLDLIRQQQPPQDGGGGEEQNDENQEQPEDPQDGGEDGSDGQQQQDAPPDERQEAGQDQTRTSPQEGEGEESETPSEPEGAQPGEGSDTPQTEVPVPEGQMSAEQASRILDAVGGEERLLLRELRRRPSRMRRSDKDW